MENFSFDAIIAKLKELAIGLASGLSEKLKNKANTGLGGFLGIILKSLGIDIDKTAEKLQEGVNEQIVKVDKNLGNAINGSKDVIANFFETQKTALGVDDATRKQLELLTALSNASIFNSSIPELDDKGRPDKSYKAALALRTKIVTYLAGDDAEEIGALPEEMPEPKRKAEAQRIASLITGIPEGATLLTVAANPPTTGFVAMAANIQLSMHEKENGSVSKEAIKMNFDPKFTVATTGVSGASEADNKDKTPTAGGNKPKTPPAR